MPHAPAHGPTHADRRVLDDDNAERLLRTYARFDDLMADGEPEDVVYVYRATPDGAAIGRFLWRTVPHPWLLETLQARGGGVFRIMIRRGRRMLYSDVLRLGATGG